MGGKFPKKRKLEGSSMFCINVSDCSPLELHPVEEQALDGDVCEALALDLADQVHHLLQTDVGPAMQQKRVGT